MNPKTTCPELAATGQLEHRAGTPEGSSASIAVLGRLKTDLGAFGGTA